MIINPPRVNEKDAVDVKMNAGIERQPRYVKNVKIQSMESTLKTRNLCYIMFTKMSEKPF